MNLHPTIHALRANGHRDTAILDLLHLQELHELPPGDAITTAQELYPSWRVSAVLLEGEWE